MGNRVYLETSVISYLAARPSRDLIVAARQKLTHDWWERRRSGFDLFVSELVVEEALAGDAAAADRRVSWLAELPRLAPTAEANHLASVLLAELQLPPKAAADALHTAIAASHEMDFLLTWNARHIANAELVPRFEACCRRLGFQPPVFCTPEQLMGV